MWSVIDIRWVENAVFLATYLSSGDAMETQIFACSRHKSGQVEYAPLQDPLMVETLDRPECRFNVWLKNWTPFKHLLLVCNATSNTIGHIGQGPTEDGGSTVIWSRVSNDLYVATLPLETFPLGMDIDLTATEEPGGDDTVGTSPTPILWSYANDGTLSAWRVINTKAGPYQSISSARNNLAQEGPASMSRAQPPTPAAALLDASAMSVGNVFSKPAFGGPVFGAGAFSSPSALNGGSNAFGKAPSFAPAFGQSTSFDMHASTPAFGQSTFGKSALPATFAAPGSKLPFTSSATPSSSGGPTASGFASFSAGSLASGFSAPANSVPFASVFQSTESSPSTTPVFSSGSSTAFGKPSSTVGSSTSPGVAFASSKTVQKSPTGTISPFTVSTVTTQNQGKASEVSSLQVPNAPTSKDENFTSDGNTKPFQDTVSPPAVNSSPAFGQSPFGTLRDSRVSASGPMPTPKKAPGLDEDESDALEPNQVNQVSDQKQEALDFGPPASSNVEKEVAGMSMKGLDFGSTLQDKTIDSKPISPTLLGASGKVATNVKQIEERAVSQAAFTPPRSGIAGSTGRPKSVLPKATDSKAGSLPSDGALEEYTGSNTVLEGGERESKAQESLFAIDREGRNTKAAPSFIALPTGLPGSSVVGPAAQQEPTATALSSQGWTETPSTTTKSAFSAFASTSDFTSTSPFALSSSEKSATPFGEPGFFSAFGQKPKEEEAKKQFFFQPPGSKTSQISSDAAKEDDETQESVEEGEDAGAEDDEEDEDEEEVSSGDTADQEDEGKDSDVSEPSIENGSELSDAGQQEGDSTEPDVTSPTFDDVTDSADPGSPSLASSPTSQPKTETKLDREETAEAVRNSNPSSAFAPYQLTEGLTAARSFDSASIDLLPLTSPTSGCGQVTPAPTPLLAETKPPTKSPFDFDLSGTSTAGPKAAEPQKPFGFANLQKAAPRTSSPLASMPSFAPPLSPSKVEQTVSSFLQAREPSPMLDLSMPVSSYRGTTPSSAVLPQNLTFSKAERSSTQSLPLVETSGASVTPVGALMTPIPKLSSATLTPKSSSSAEKGDNINVFQSMQDQFSAVSRNAEWSL